MVLTTRAIVLSSLKYSEADLIVSCFTEQSGLKSYLLRGVLKSKKGKLKASHFLPLTQLELVVSHRNKGSLERIQEAKVSQPYRTLHTHVVKSGLVMFLSEILRNSIQEEEPNKELFQYLEQSLHWLDHHDSIANFHILFLIKLSAYLGFYPDASAIEYHYFNLAEGIFQENPLDPNSEKGPQIHTFKAFFGIDFDALPQIKLTKKERADTLDLVLRYYQLHIQGYKQPRSLLVLNQLY
ncbi:DNA repair protein RecO [Altibacter sp.]|uniref:DNA repair protein RecO n=1 Tax=Altibacter sp. TaxID=2024823 RepID=UPI000C96FE5C|nr:DNA repair protein RecO [Altibacter sp.]MAP55796.1 DNA repair protein RecO [Altibacter sp.]